MTLSIIPDKNIFVTIDTTSIAVLDRGPLFRVSHEQPKIGIHQL